MTRLDDLPKTSAGQVPKRHALRWLSEVDDTDSELLTEAFVPKPVGYTGCTYPTQISDFRVTGDPSYVEAVAGLVKSVLAFENDVTRLDIKLQQIPDRDTGRLTDNYAFYLAVAERDLSSRP